MKRITTQFLSKCVKMRTKDRIKNALSQFLKKLHQLSDMKSFDETGSESMTALEYDFLSEMFAVPISEMIESFKSQSVKIGNNVFSPINLPNASQTTYDREQTTREFFFLSPQGNLGFVYSVIPRNDQSAKIAAMRVKLFMKKVSSSNGIPPILSISSSDMAVAYVFNIHKSHFDGEIDVRAAYSVGNIITCKSRSFIFPIEGDLSTRLGSILSKKRNMGDVIDDLNSADGSIVRKKCNAMVKSDEWKEMKRLLLEIIHNFEMKGKYPITTIAEGMDMFKKYLTPEEAVVLGYFLEIFAYDAYSFAPHTKNVTGITMKECLKDYTVGPYLANGIYGAVHKGTHKKTGEAVAIKIFTQNHLGIYYDGIVGEFLFSKKLHKLRLGPKVYGFYRCTVGHERRIVLIKGFVEGKTLNELIKKMSSAECSNIMREMDKMQKTLVENHIVGSDFNPNNLLVDRNGNLNLVDAGYITDFGELKTLPHQESDLDFDAGIVLRSSIIHYVEKQLGR